MGKFWNRVKNTLGIAPRTVKTAGRTIIDTTKSALNIVLEPFIGLGKTGVDIKKAVHESFTKGPRYHKLRKVPTSLALTPFMAIEGVAETLRGTGVNACSSVRDIIGNTLKNEGSAIKMMGRSEKFDFSTEKLEYKKVSPRNRLAGLFKPKTEIDVEKDVLKDKKKHLKEQEEKLKKDKEYFAKDKENRFNEKKKERESWQESKKSEQEKYTQTLNKQRDSFNKEKEALNNRIAILEQEKKELQSTLKSSENSEKKAEVVKLNPKAEKKENGSENKEAKIVKLDTKPEEKAETKGEPKEAKVVKLEPKEEKPEIKPEKKTEAKSESKEKGEKSEDTENKKIA